ncbi:VirB4 family type IV secretion/conjugal transfer ATPase [Orbus sturtevantii]|uniref:VirB4 family type IV secretion/conjugal transfer ATPase n=1 Tax=Orbus sturtevantii TaxID=3074109 RepID=UPI00370D56D9
MMNKNQVYKALTRPPLVFGVPISPLVIVFSFCALLAIYTNLLYFIFFVPIFFILKLLTKMDEKIFQIIGTKIHLLPQKIKSLPIKSKINAFYYSSINYSARSKSKLNLISELKMIDIEKAISLNQIIPYSTQIDNDKIMDRNGFLLSTWEIEGISYALRDDHSLDAYKNKLNSLFITLAIDNISFYFHTIKDNSEDRLEGKFENAFAREINDKYFRSLENSKEYMESRLFVTVIFKKNRAEKLAYRMAKDEDKKSDIEMRIHDFDEKCNSIETILNSFGARKLTCYKKNDQLYSQQLEFYNYLLTFKKQPIKVLNTHIYSYLGGADYSVYNGIIKVIKGNDIAYCQCIEIKDWVSYSEAGFLDELANFPAKLIISQSFTPLSKAEARSTIIKQIKQLKSADDDAVQQRADLEVALEQLINGDFVLGSHHFSVFLFANSEEELSKIINLFNAKMADLGFITAINRLAVEESFFSQLPSNFKFRQRLSDITSINFADFNSLHNNPIGKQQNNAWGEAVTVFKTNANQPYYFNFHQSKQGRDDFGEMVLAHTLVIGKSGTGKTMTLDFLLTQLMKFSVESSFPQKSENKKFTAFFFDKDYGAKIAVKALGGVYNELKLGQPTHFNPFMLDSSDDNIIFLNELIQMLAYGEDVPSISIKNKINLAVNSLMNMAKEERTYPISRLLQSIQEDNDDNSLLKRLTIWSNGNANGWVFDNEFDSLNFDIAPLFAFDGTEILDKKEIVSPISFYLLYRIRQILDGRRLPIIMDEFWMWLNSPSFEPFIKDGLKTFRKLNAFMVFATQSPDEVLRSSIARTIVEQIETFLFLPNAKADFDQYTKQLQVSEKEYKIIKNLADDSRQFLIKKADDPSVARGNSVLAKIDLGGLGKGNLKILSASMDNITIMEKAIKEVGNNPDDWIPIFKDKCV